MEDHLLLVVFATLMAVPPSQLQQQWAPCSSSFGDFDDSNSCFTFIRCRDGVAIRFQCPADAPYFDLALRRCSGQQRIDCAQMASHGGGIKTTVQQFQSVQLSQPGLPPKFPQILGGGDAMTAEVNQETSAATVVPPKNINTVSSPFLPISIIPGISGGDNNTSTPTPSVIQPPARTGSPETIQPPRAFPAPRRLPVNELDPTGRGGVIPAPSVNPLDGVDTAEGGTNTTGLGSQLVNPGNVFVPTGVNTPANTAKYAGGSAPQGVADGDAVSAGGAVSANAMAGAGSGADAQAQAGASASVGPDAGINSLPDAWGASSGRASVSVVPSSNTWQQGPPATGVWIPDADGNPVLWVPGAGVFSPQQFAGANRAINDARQLEDRAPPSQTINANQPLLTNQEFTHLNDHLNDLQNQARSQATARALATSGNGGSASASASAVASGNNQGQGRNLAQG